MSFQVDDQVIVNEKCPYLTDQSGTVTDTEYMGCVVVQMDNNGQMRCFLPEELQMDQPSNVCH
jgi:hypothetical protein